MEIEEEGENASSTMLSGFLFGNIDKKGHLENDILDEVIYTSPLQLTLHIVFTTGGAVPKGGAIMRWALYYSTK